MRERSGVLAAGWIEWSSGVKKLLVLENCTQCPHYHHGHSYSLDGWDRGSDGLCRLAKDKVVVSFIERPKDEPETIPDWCPLP